MGRKSTAQQVIFLIGMFGLTYWLVSIGQHTGATYVAALAILIILLVRMSIYVNRRRPRTASRQSRALARGQDDTDRMATPIMPSSALKKPGGRKSPLPPPVGHHSRAPYLAGQRGDEMLIPDTGVLLTAIGYDGESSPNWRALFEYFTENIERVRIPGVVKSEVGHVLAGDGTDGQATRLGIFLKNTVHARPDTEVVSALEQAHNDAVNHPNSGKTVDWIRLKKADILGRAAPLPATTAARASAAKDLYDKAAQDRRIAGAAAAIIKGDDDHREALFVCGDEDILLFRDSVYRVAGSYLRVIHPKLLIGLP